MHPTKNFLHRLFGQPIDGETDRDERLAAVTARTRGVLATMRMTEEYVIAVRDAYEQSERRIAASRAHRKAG